jgi:hypothetical protein
MKAVQKQKTLDFSGTAVTACKILVQYDMLGTGKDFDET